jgi:hypothetical protein
MQSDPLKGVVPMSRVASAAPTAAFLALWLAVPALTQTTSAEINSSVVDSSGAVIRNVTSLGGEYA